MRLGSGSVNTKSYNNVLQVLAPAYGVQYFKLSGPQPKCEYCIRYYGRIYRQGMFMPEFPSHPNCFHEWDAWFPWEKESGSQPIRILPTKLKIIGSNHFGRITR
jgi:hypothetical protein